MSSETKIPNILVLGAITPSPSSARSNRLEYEKLQPTVDEHLPYEKNRQDRFWDAEEGSMEERSAAKQLAMQYLLMGSLALTKSSDPELWSQRYTQATSEIYGMPQPEIAHQLREEQQKPSEVETTEPGFAEAARLAGEYFNDKYANVFIALELDESTKSVSPEMIADKFEAAIRLLAEKLDPEWSNWIVERNEEKDSLSVIARDKKILVGMRRADALPEQLVPLFAHEVLVHGLRAVNGGKINEELGLGMTDYLDAEEGFGVFVEYAISGKVSQKIKDRYADIAYALGQIDGVQHTRQELLNIAFARAYARNDSAKDDNKRTSEDIEKEVYASVNRIYRGSLGDEHVGIFTKDISYYKGFVDIGEYVQSRIDAGENIADIIDFLSVGKFDPTNQQHLDFIQETAAK